MSSSSEYSYQKPSFSQRCGMLSQYIKEKRSFGDLTLGITCNTEPTAAGAQKLSLLLPEATPATTMNLFPQQSGFVSPLAKEAVPKMADSRTKKSAIEEPKTAQMTIFYAGKLIVLDNLTAEKAKEVMLLATKGSSQLSHNSFAFTGARRTADAGSLNPPSTSVVPNFGNNLIQEKAQRPSLPVVCDLPIARRASLHRFLEKRKDRVTVKPYQSDSPVSSKPAESKPWLGLTAQSPKSFLC